MDFSGALEHVNSAKSRHATFQAEYYVDGLGGEVGFLGVLYLPMVFERQFTVLCHLKKDYLKRTLFLSMSKSLQHLVLQSLSKRLQGVC